MSHPRILVSNDDGIAAFGIRALSEALRAVGDVWVVAPDRERSATSHAISLHKPLRVREVGEQAFAVDGTPTDCVYMALHHILPKPPDIVVSGINHGPNLGNDVLYSGTVSAAMEGALFGHRAIAVSLCLPESRGGAPLTLEDFQPGAAFAATLARSTLDRPMPPGVLLNVNVPMGQPRGYKLARLGYTDWTDHVSARQDPRGRPYFWIGGERQGHDTIADSDNNALAAGYISVTPVHYDLTDYRSFVYMRSLAVSGYDVVPDGMGDGPLAHPVHPRLGNAPKS